jgi:hypothetical protein
VTAFGQERTDETGKYFRKPGSSLIVQQTNKTVQASYAVTTNIQRLTEYSGG